MPRTCSGKSSPGVNNHWPKWSPDRLTYDNRTYYWLIFSSNRYGLPPIYSLHARLWKANPAGMFAPWNPNVSCAAA